jgi:type VI secretion system secreted protein VgrG
VDTHESVEAASAEEDCRCEFVALDARRAFRPERRTRRPVVEGPQTAIVVGPADQEIWTDEYGRVKLQFHWDRFGGSTEASSCWVRVAQLWAGSGFGGLHVPRVGQEVIVDFLEGDPDRPIVVGRVYNADNRPPYELPANQTQSGLKSRSVRDALPENCNEIRFEDKRGQEQLFIQAERDQLTTVKNDQLTTISAKQTLSVGTEQLITIGTAQTLTIGGAQTLSVGAGRVALVGAADSTTVMGLRDTTVHGADSLTAKGPRSESFESGRSTTIQSGDATSVTGGGKTTSVEGAYAVGAKTFGVSADSSIAFECPSGSISVGPAAPGSPAGTPATMLTLVATDALVLQCGESSIFISKDGISISSPNSVAAMVGDNVMGLSPDEAMLAGKKTTVCSDGDTDVMGSKVNLRRAPPRKSLKKL